MSLSDLLTDTVNLLKANGEEVTKITAAVTSKTIIIQRSDILIESGDVIQNVMTNGATDAYEVIDPGFTEKKLRFPAQYIVKVKKLGISEAKAAMQHITTINMSGHNSRVNQNSTDNSVNVVNMSPDLQVQIEALRAEIMRANLPEADFEAANEIVDSVESELDKPKPSSVVVKLLLDGLSAFGSIASLASIAPAILQLLKG